MPMSEDNRNSHTREQIAHTIFARLTTMAAREWPGLSDGQRRGLVDHIVGIVGEWGAQVPDHEYKTQFYLAERNAELKEFFRPTPTPGELEAALLKANNVTDPRARLDLHREIGPLDADGRLARSKGLTIAPVVAPDAAPVHGVGEKPAHLLSERELAAVVRAKFGPNLRASQVKAHGDMLAAASRPKETPSINAIKGKLALGKNWKDINPATRLAAEREAKDVYGKTLGELGIKAS